jgi:exonuclease III
MADHLSILNWNVRGLNPPARREAVKDMLQSHKARLIYRSLQETKLASVCRQTALEFLGQALDGYQYLPAEGTKGGILLGWNSDFVETSNLLLKEFSLSMCIRLKLDGSTFRLTVVYGPSEDMEKTRFLQ